MSPLPTGTITFLFTDVAGSTRLWEAGVEPMREALQRYDDIVTETVAAQGGTLVRPRGEGDSFFAVFPFASEAVLAAARIQRLTSSEVWPTADPVRIRVALHSGEADLRDGDYYGREVNRCARIRSLAQGGQTLLSQATVELARRALPPSLQLRALGPQKLHDLQERMHVFELVWVDPDPITTRRKLHWAARALLKHRGLGLASAATALLLLLLFLTAPQVGLGRKSPSRDIVLSTTPSDSDSSSPRPSTSPSPPYGRLRAQRDSALHPSGINFTIAADSLTLKPNQPLTLTVSMTNPSPKKRQIEFPIGQLFDLDITILRGSEAGREVYRWSEGQLFSTEPVSVVWQPGGLQDFKITWLPPRAQGKGKGIVYKITATMLSEDPVEVSLELSTGD